MLKNLRENYSTGTRSFWRENIFSEAFKWKKSAKALRPFWKKSEKVENILKKRYDRIGI